MVVDVRLENKGENAYNARLNITYTPNLRFSSLRVKVRYHHQNSWASFNIRGEHVYFNCVKVFSDLTADDMR